MKKLFLLKAMLFMALFLCSVATLADNPWLPGAGPSGKVSLYGKYRKDIGLNFDMGLNGSGAYRGVIKDHYYGETVSGGMMWLSLGIGLDYRVIGNLFVETRLTWLNTFLSVPSSLEGFNNEKINSDFLPGLGAKYYIFFKHSDEARDNYKNLGIYVAGRIYKNKPSSDISDLTFTSGGGSRCLAAGMHIQEPIGSINFEIGNRWIPVKVNEETSAREFGGIFVEVSTMVYLCNYSWIRGKIK